MSKISTKCKFLGVQVKDAEESDSMTFSGYGAVFGNVDSYGDIIEKGSFLKSLEKHAKEGTFPVMLSQHGGFGSQDMTPVGIWTEMKEDEHGLYVEGKLADTPRGRELYTLMKMTPRPAIDGMSIGFFCTDAYDEKQDNEVIRHITGVDLLEISLVTFPANDEARIADVKSETTPSIREAERALREAGFSRSEAKGILAKGYKSVSLREAGDGDCEKEIADAIRRNITAIAGR